MKRLKLRGREIRRLGYKDEEVISLAKNIMEKQYKRTKKEDALTILKDILDHPNNYRNDPLLSPLVKTIASEGKCSASPIELRSKPVSYTVYGKEETDVGSIQQMETAMHLPVTLKGALMPDAHQGYGLPIGGVVAANNAVMPYGVGMDIACRMSMSIYALPANEVYNRHELLKKILRDNSKFGRDRFAPVSDHWIFEQPEFQEIPFLNKLIPKVREQLGTSGGGNHFVEIGIFSTQQTLTEWNIQPGTYLAVLSHSGSRNFGASIANHYTRIAKEKCKLPKGATNLAWLNMQSEAGEEYWKAMNLAGKYAEANHTIIHQNISNALGSTPITRIENHHNFAWKEQLPDGQEVVVHRKGATPASQDATGIIPGSMISPAYLVRGKGHPDSINSAAHGAGRIMSRARAKKTFTQKDLQDVLDKAGVTLIGGGLDEIPMAYKNIHTVMHHQNNLVETLGMFYPKIIRME